MNVYEVTIDRKERARLRVVACDQYQAIDVANEILQAKGWSSLYKESDPDFSWSAQLKANAEDVIHPFLYQSNILPSEWREFIEETKVELVTEWLAKLGLPAEHTSTPEVFRPVMDAIDQSIRAINSGLDLY